MAFNSTQLKKTIFNLYPDFRQHGLLPKENHMNKNIDCRLLFFVETVHALSLQKERKPKNNLQSVPLLHH